MLSPARPTAMQIVLNGAAGNRDDEGVLSALAQVLGGAGREFALHRAPQPSALPATAAQAADAAGPGGTVVAVGGDGTLNTVAGVVHERAAVLGLVPRGTFNLFARTHGIPLEPGPAAQLLLHGRAQPVPVARVNGRLFLVNASVGLYPELLQDREAWKARWGRNRLVALGAGLASLLHEHRRLVMSLQVDGAAPRERRVGTLFVSQNALQLERLGLPEAADVGPQPEDGEPRLGAMVLRSVRPGELLWLALRGAVGRLGEADNVDHFACRRLSARVRWRSRVSVSVDGEVTRLATPLAFAIDERPLWLIRGADGR